jgi:hypothetical protein
MPTKMLRAEDLAAMTGSALVAHYNQLVEENPELGYKKTERFADYQRKLMKARRDAGYAEIEKKHRDKPHTKRPAQKKSMEKAWTKSPKLLKIHKKHEDKEKARRDAIAERALKRIAKKKAAMEAKKKPAKKSASKPAAKKASKPVAKKVAPKKPVAKKGFGGKRKLS